jgi:hypothetical protein
LLADFKLQVLRELLEGRQIGLGWLFCVTYSVSLALASTAAVVYIAPAAAGSGVPEVMAFLNGVQLPKVFNLECMAVKFISCIFAIGAGLPVGPEGPMIHLGAMIGAALSQGESTTLGCAMPCAKRDGFFGFKVQSVPSLTLIAHQVVFSPARPMWCPYGLTVRAESDSVCGSVYAVIGQNGNWREDSLRSIHGSRFPTF